MSQQKESMNGLQKFQEYYKKCKLDHPEWTRAIIIEHWKEENPLRVDRKEQRARGYQRKLQPIEKKISKVDTRIKKAEELAEKLKAHKESLESDKSKYGSNPDEYRKWLKETRAQKAEEPKIEKITKIPKVTEIPKKHIVIEIKKEKPVTNSHRHTKTTRNRLVK